MAQESKVRDTEDASASLTADMGSENQAIGTKFAAHVDLFGLGLSPSDRIPERRGCWVPSSPKPGIVGIFP
jgi:hypothetical protein